MSLSVSFERHELELSRPFTIARGTQTHASVVTVTVTDDTGTTGVGGAGPSRHYGDTAETVEAVLPVYAEVVESFAEPEPVVAIEDAMRERVRGNPAARTAVSIALHDLIGKRADRSLHRLWGLPSEAVDTSFTIGIDPPEEMAANANEAVAAGHDILKVKLGTDADRERIQAIRDAVPDVTIRVDANEAWRPKEAVELCGVLAEHDVEFVEQPVPAEQPEALRYVGEHSPLPIAADESCVELDDIPQIADAVQIANLKLMKCGGLVEAKRMIHAAQAHGLEVMLGCMGESSASIAGAAQLAPLLDYADLDGALLLEEDPYDGPVRADGTIALDPATPGTGVRPSE